MPLARQKPEVRFSGRVSRSEYWSCAVSSEGLSEEGGAMGRGGHSEREVEGACPP